MNVQEHYEYDPGSVEWETVYVVRVTTADRSVPGGVTEHEFTDKAQAESFKRMAEDDGTYWGIYQKRRVVQ